MRVRAVEVSKEGKGERGKQQKTESETNENPLDFRIYSRDSREMRNSSRALGGFFTGRLRRFGRFFRLGSFGRFNIGSPKSVSDKVFHQY